MSRVPLDLVVEVDPQHTEGQARARIFVTAPGSREEITIYSEVVYDYPEEGRGAAVNVVRLFSSRLRRLMEDE